MHVDHVRETCAASVSAARTSVYQLNHEFNMKAGAVVPFLLGLQVCFFTNAPTLFPPPYWCGDIFM